MPYRLLVESLADRATSLVGGTLIGLGGLWGAATVEMSGANASWIGVALATIGLLTMVIPQHYKDRSEERALKQKALADKVAALEAQGARDSQEKAELARKAAILAERVEADAVDKARLATKLDDLERKGVAGNTLAISAQEGRLDAAFRTLRERGAIQPPIEGDHRPGTVWPRLLLVEDHPGTVRAWTAVFTHWGFNVKVCSSADCAILAIEQDTPAWVVVDPGLDTPDEGLAVLEYVRKNGLGVRIAVTTGSEDGAMIARIRSLKPDGLFIKPIDSTELKKLIQPAAPNPPPVPRGAA